MKRKILTFLLALAVVLVSISYSTTARAEGGNAAKIGDTEYATLQAAINGAVENDIIELLSDVTESPSISKSLYIDLGGYKITPTNQIKISAGEVHLSNGMINSNFTDAILTSDNAVLYLDAGLTVDVPNGAAFYVTENSKLIVNGAVIKSEAVEPQYTIICVDNNAEVVVEKGTITGNTACISTYPAPGCSAKIYIKGGTLNSNRENSVVVATGKEASQDTSIEITGGTLTGTHSIVGIQKGTGKITDGTFKSTEGYAAIYGYEGTTIDFSAGSVDAAADAFQATGGCEINISGGEFNADRSVISSGFNGNADGSVINVTGGTFTGEQIQTHSAEVNIEDGTFEVTNVLAAGGNINISGGEFTADLIQAQSNNNNVNGTIKINGGDFTVKNITKSGDGNSVIIDDENDPSFSIDTFNEEFYKETGKELLIFNSDGMYHLAKPFTVKFDTKGGTEIEDQKVGEGDTAVRPSEDPVKEGYIFKGWYKDSASQNEFSFDTAITGNTTIYAKWE